MNPQTAGDRLYLIRLAHGDGKRTPEPLASFAKRVEKATGRWYDPATISLLERGKQKWRLEDAEVLCQVDKEKRGKVWLAFGPKSDEEPEKRRKAGGGG